MQQVAAEQKSKKNQMHTAAWRYDYIGMYLQERMSKWKRIEKNS